MLRGLGLWLLVCAVLVGLQAAGVAESPALPVLLVLALVVARAFGESPWLRRRGWVIAVLVED